MGKSLFLLPAQEKTIITNPSNLIYDDDVDGEYEGKIPPDDASNDDEGP